MPIAMWIGSELSFVIVISSSIMQRLLLSLVLICRRPTWDVASGMAWDNAAAYVNIYRRHIICRRHWSPACLRSWTQLNFAGKSVVNAWDRLCVGDKCSHMPQLSQAVPAAMSQVGRRHMRTRLYAAYRILKSTRNILNNVSICTSFCK